MKIAVLPARGGSRRIPRKNIAEFHGFPMISYPLRAARESKLFDLLVVSTDDVEIAALAFDWGAIPVGRPLDDGETGTQEVAARVLDKLQIQGGICCVIYPCTPLITSDLLKGGYKELTQTGNHCFVRSVTPLGEDAGAFYWGWVRAFRDRTPLDEYNTRDFALPAERAIDINTPEDWERAQTMFQELQSGHR